MSSSRRRAIHIAASGLRTTLSTMSLTISSTRSISNLCPRRLDVRDGVGIGCRAGLRRRGARARRTGFARRHGTESGRRLELVAGGTRAIDEHVVAVRPQREDLLVVFDEEALQEEWRVD